jgi:hypothetical protein
MARTCARQTGSAARGCGAAHAAGTTVDPVLRLTGGRFLERIHLAATAAGLGLQHMNQITERIDRERALGRPATFAPAFDALIAQPGQFPWRPSGSVTRSGPPASAPDGRSDDRPPVPPAHSGQPRRRREGMPQSLALDALDFKPEGRYLIFAKSCCSRASSEVMLAVEDTRSSTAPLRATSVFTFGMPVGILWVLV